MAHVCQAQLLGQLFANALREHEPQSVAVLGCAGGNGFEPIPASVKRVVGVDLNPDYIAAARERFAHRLSGLELYISDLERDDLRIVPVALVFAGLLFEYVHVDTLLDRISSWLQPQGTLVSVVQLASPTINDITPSPFTSLERLLPILNLVAPERLAELAAERGYQALGSHIATVESSKRFSVQTFCDRGSV